MITGINIVRNCLSTGYPFLESILSAIPLCDQYFVNDGGSTDGTLEALQELSESYPKVKVYQIPDTESVRWDCVSDQINAMIKDVPDRSWIFLGNADELLHEDDIIALLDYFKPWEHRIMRFIRKEITYNWSALGSDVYHPARMARKVDGMRQDWNAYGGDEFLFNDGWEDPKRKLVSPFTIYHFYNMFPVNQIRKLENDALHLSPGDEKRVATWKRLKDSSISSVKATKVYPRLPALMRGLAGLQKYYIRKELFDVKWVEELTGLKYL